MNYNGMRWFKFDFQMQTPGDHLNWCHDDPAYLGGTYNEEQLEHSVELYLNRCYEVGLDAICVTDHNFIGREYLQKLQMKSSILAAKLDRSPLIIFPGFEVEIAQGLGVHLLCIFNYDKPLQDIDDVVTLLGLPNNNRVRDGAIVASKIPFDELVRIVQYDNNGVIIAAHPTAESGFLNNRFITENFQRDMFINPSLLAMEVPKPLAALSPGWRSLILTEASCNAEWRRERRIAAVMSSDAYRLYEGNKGHIGKRSTWIKMSTPTVESIIQAFLDCERISLQSHSPSEDINHDRVVSIKFSDVAFLEDQHIHLSPNLNCIIGGRGSGKSSILEYIRLSSHHGDEINHDSDQITRIKNTISSTASIQLEWQYRNGLTDTFEYSLGDHSPRILGREVQELRAVFGALNIEVLSQREISKLAQKQSNLSKLIDKLTGPELVQLKSAETELISEIQQLQQTKNRNERLVLERRVALQEKQELVRQWDAYVSVKRENERKTKANLAKRFLDDILQESTQITDVWTERARNLVSRHAPILEQNWIETDYFSLLNDGLLKAKSQLQDDIAASLINYNKNIVSLTTLNDEWESINAAIQKTETDFNQACLDRGLKPEDLEVLQETEGKISLKDRELDSLEEKLDSYSQDIELLERKQIQLFENWEAQLHLKNTRLREILFSGDVPTVAPETPFISVEIFHSQDYNHFLAIWNDISIRRTTRLGRSWETIGSILFGHFTKQTESKSPWALLDKWCNDETLVPPDISHLHQELKNFVQVDQKILFENLQTVKVNDRINITLYRSDGTRAGSLEDNGLSDGQKNTAILALLFAHGNNPIIIDQPEDELDSDFIYNELVPLLRKVKYKRQIILSTHNANIPVNGDCELLVALHTNMGRGRLRAIGGLENPEVRDTVLHIMEGSKEAFERRKEKYAF